VSATVTCKGEQQAETEDKKNAAEDKEEVVAEKPV